jgi:hypothetical protein
MVAQIHQRNVDAVKSMLPSAAARPGFNPIGDAMHPVTSLATQGQGCRLSNWREIVSAFNDLWFSTPVPEQGKICPFEARHHVLRHLIPLIEIQQKSESLVQQVFVAGESAPFNRS